MAGNNEDKSEVEDKGFSFNNQLVCSIIPKLTNELHKGSSGRIGVIGGSREYTGAPYFASISTIKVGADLCYVFTTNDSAPVIKSYSPELIVHPILDSSNAVEEVSNILPKIHALVIGPGLGRCESLLSTIGSLINRIKDIGIPMILDADSLHFICQCPDIIRGYKKAILTPNAHEFDRLYATVYNNAQTGDLSNSVKELCRTLGGVTIVRKGQEDIISDGETTITCNEAGSPRRCGGQGDLLAGSLGTFTYWSFKTYQRMDQSQLLQQKYSPTMVAALGAAMLTRRCSRLAFYKFGRSMTTADMISEIHKSFVSLFDHFS